MEQNKVENKNESTQDRKLLLFNNNSRVVVPLDKYRNMTNIVEKIRDFCNVTIQNLGIAQNGLETDDLFRTVNSRESHFIIDRMTQNSLRFLYRKNTNVDA